LHIVCLERVLTSCVGSSTEQDARVQILNFKRAKVVQRNELKSFGRILVSKNELTSHRNASLARYFSNLSWLAFGDGNKVFFQLL